MCYLLFYLFFSDAALVWRSRSSYNNDGWETGDEIDGENDEASAHTLMTTTSESKSINVQSKNECGNSQSSL